MDRVVYWTTLEGSHRHDRWVQVRKFKRSFDSRKKEGEWRTVKEEVLVTSEVCVRRTTTYVIID